ARLDHQHRRAPRQRRLGPGQIGLRAAADLHQDLTRASRAPGAYHEHTHTADRRLVPHRPRPLARAPDRPGAVTLLPPATLRVYAVTAPRKPAAACVCATVWTTRGAGT